AQSLLYRSLSCSFTAIHYSSIDSHSIPTRRSSDLGRQRAESTPARQRARGRRATRQRAGAAALGLGARGARAQIHGSAIDHPALDRKSTRLNSSHLGISYAVFCLKKNTTLYIHVED